MSARRGPDAHLRIRFFFFFFLNGPVLPILPCPSVERRVRFHLSAGFPPIKVGTGGAPTPHLTWEALLAELGRGSRMLVVVAFCVPAAFCLRPSSCFARGVGTIAMQPSISAQRPERSAEMLATSIHVWSRSLVSMLDKQVLDQLGSPLSVNTGADTSRSPLLARLEAMEGFWYSDDFYGPHGREWVQV